MQRIEIWEYRQSSELGYDPTNGRDITGYHVEALDGSIGTVDEANVEAGRNFLVADTGPWIFGKRVMLPAGVIERVDEAEERVWVNRTKDEIKNAPEFDDSRFDDHDYHDELGSYYGPGGIGYRNWDTPR